MSVWGKPNIKWCTHSHSMNLVKPSGMTTSKLQLHNYHLKEREMVSAHSPKKDTGKIRTYHQVESSFKRGAVMKRWKWSRCYILRDIMWPSCMMLNLVGEGGRCRQEGNKLKWELIKWIWSRDFVLKHHHITIVSLHWHFYCTSSMSYLDVSKAGHELISCRVLM